MHKNLTQKVREKQNEFLVNQNLKLKIKGKKKVKREKTTIPISGPSGPLKISHKQSFIVSPVYGTLKNIIRTKMEGRSYYRFGIYIAVSDIHEIYAPVSSTVIDITPVKGNFLRPGKFKAWQKEEGRIEFTFLTNVNFYSDAKILCWIYVGKGWITDEIDIDIEEGSQVRAGEKIGDITIHSWAELYVPTNMCNFELLAAPGTVLKGGSSKLAMWTTIY